jgi:DNA polymerase III delta prime subunit
MTGSFIIFGGNITERQAKADTILSDLGLRREGVNVLTIEPQEGKRSIGIEQVKQALSFLDTKPTMAPNKAVVFLHAETITNDGQNAFLKTLEEPPVYATILLVTKNSDDLLPTIRSRCRLLGIRKNEGRVGEGIGEGIGEGSALDLFNVSLGERLTWAEEVSKEEKEDVLEILEKSVTEIRDAMLTNTPKYETRYASAISKILEVKKDLERTNINTRLALENMVLTMDKE